MLALQHTFHNRKTNQSLQTDTTKIPHLKYLQIITVTLSRPQTQCAANLQYGVHNAHHQLDQNLTTVPCCLARTALYWTDPSRRDTGQRTLRRLCGSSLSQGSWGLLEGKTHMMWGSRRYRWLEDIVAWRFHCFMWFSMGPLKEGGLIQPKASEILRKQA